MINEYLRVFRAFTDERRVRVLELLCGGEQCACVLLEDLNISQPTLSHHMKILCASGIVKSRRKGQWNYYSINADGCEYGSRLLDMVAKRKLNGSVKFALVAHRLSRLFKKRSAAETLEQYAAAASCCCAK